jgi:hypothetical protein
MKVVLHEKSAVFCIYEETGKILYVDASSNYEKKIDQMRQELIAGTFEDELLQSYANIYGVSNLLASPIFFCKSIDLLVNKYKFISFLNPVFQGKRGSLKLTNEKGELDEIVAIVRKNFKGQFLPFHDIYNWLVSNGHTNESEKRIAMRLKVLKKMPKRDDKNRIWIKVM